MGFFYVKKERFLHFLRNDTFWWGIEFQKSGPNFSGGFLCKIGFSLFARDFPKFKKHSFLADADLGLTFLKMPNLGPKKVSKKRQKRGLFSHEVATIPPRQNLPGFGH